MKQIYIILSLIVLSTLGTLGAHAESKDVSMRVGETETLYLPSSVTSKNLKSVTFYSNGISYVQVVSYNNYSVKVKAVKAFSSPIIVRCDYKYFVGSGSFTYEASGYYDFNITVSDSGNGGGSDDGPTRIYFSSSAESVRVNESKQLKPNIEPANRTFNLTWSINDTSVATVDQNGVLTGKREGYADLTVMADNGQYAMLRIVVSGVLKPNWVTITPSELELTEGDYRYLSASVSPPEAPQGVTWTSSNSSVATVSSTGKVTAVAPGYCLIQATTLTYNEYSYCSVTVKRKIVEPTSVTLSPESAEIMEGESIKLTATLIPSNSETNLKWESDNPEIATVENGIVTGMAQGDCTITVKTGNGLQSSMQITVYRDISQEEPEEPETPDVIPSGIWERTHIMYSKVCLDDLADYNYPETFELTINKDDDGKYYIKTFIGFDCTKCVCPSTGLRLTPISESEMKIDMDYNNDLGSYTISGEYLDGFHFLSASPEYDNKENPIILHLDEDGVLTISDFYVYNLFGIPNTSDYVLMAGYSGCTSNKESLNRIDNNRFDSNDQYIEVYTIQGYCLFKGQVAEAPSFPKGIYIIRRKNSVVKVTL